MSKKHQPVTVAPTPYPGPSFAKPMRPDHMEANYEASRTFQLDRKDISKELLNLTASQLRDRITKAIAPLDGHFYDAKAMELVAAFEIALRKAWEEGERGFVRQRAFDSVRNALEAVSDGRLL